MTDTKRYSEFVNGVTSQPSKNNEPSFIVFKNWRDKDSSERLTAAVGMSLEVSPPRSSRRLSPSKPVTEENLFHPRRELGDIMW